MKIETERRYSAFLPAGVRNILKMSRMFVFQATAYGEMNKTSDGEPGRHANLYFKAP